MNQAIEVQYKRGHEFYLILLASAGDSNGGISKFLIRDDDMVKYGLHPLLRRLGDDADDGYNDTADLAELKRVLDGPLQYKGLSGGLNKTRRIANIFTVYEVL